MFRSTTSFETQVTSLPDVKPLITIEQCDDDDNNDGKSIFNLTDKESLISVDYQNETFEYYTSSDFDINSKIMIQQHSPMMHLTKVFMLKS